MRVKLKDIATIERAKKDKIYSKGSIAFQVSATSGDFYYLFEDGKVEDKYAVLTLKKHNEYYIYNAIESRYLDYFNRVKNGLNVLPIDIINLEIDIITDTEKQEEIANLFYGINRSIELEKKELGLIKDVKTNFLNEKLFCQKG